MCRGKYLITKTVLSILLKLKQLRFTKLNSSISGCHKVFIISRSTERSHGSPIGPGPFFTDFELGSQHHVAGGLCG